MVLLIWYHLSWSHPRSDVARTHVYPSLEKERNSIKLSTDKMRRIYDQEQSAKKIQNQCKKRRLKLFHSKTGKMNKQQRLPLPLKAPPISTNALKPSSSPTYQQQLHHYSSGTVSPPRPLSPTLYTTAPTPSSTPKNDNLSLRSSM
ncbi:hypothetical protein T440DRAFT_24212 [Plenodomus tracheiphilus IPT5]|uniref:Uncharacterized protein n=1 Tax=Plenodomus tracheiphilus IPT5 TaxID=1408161 RepID=A0A6A7BCI0_9PLEO|nr:hypothetical protein T440DRAFT_24212 [Plenodomus tracheiphilus IPT5]